MYSPYILIKRSKYLVLFSYSLVLVLFVQFKEEQLSMDPFEESYALCLKQQSVEVFISFKS